MISVLLVLYIFMKYTFSLKYILVKYTFKIINIMNLL